MRVLIITQYFPPDVVGSGTRAYNIATGLADQGADVTVITAFPHYPEGKIPNKYKNKILAVEKNNLKVIRVWIPAIPHNKSINRLLLHFSFIFSSLFAVFLVGDIDTIFASSPNLFSIFPSCFFSFLKRKRIVRNVDDLWPEVFYEFKLVNSKWLMLVLDLIAQASYRIPVLITPISNGYKDFIVEKYKINPQKIFVIEVGVDKIHFVDHKENKSDNFTIMYSGLLGMGYDFNIIFKAAKILLKINNNILFNIRGVGELSNQLINISKKYSNIHVHANFLPKSELVELLSFADLFILPMRSGGIVDKGLPTKLFEYQSYGKPIICISSGESAKYLVNTKSGIVVNPGDVDGLVIAVMKLYNDRNYCLELGANGQNYVIKNLTYDILGKKIFILLKNIIK